MTRSTRDGLNTDQILLVAEHLKALAEPARLEILRTLLDGPLTVGEVVHRTGLHQANVSKHLQVLHVHRIVTRERDRQWIRYALTDPRVFELCEMVCDGLEDAVKERSKLLGV